MFTYILQIGWLALQAACLSYHNKKVFPCFVVVSCFLSFERISYTFIVRFLSVYSSLSFLLHSSWSFLFIWFIWWLCCLSRWYNISVLPFIVLFSVSVNLFYLISVLFIDLVYIYTLSYVLSLYRLFYRFFVYFIFFPSILSFFHSTHSTCSWPTRSRKIRQ